MTLTDYVNEFIISNETGYIADCRFQLGLNRRIVGTLSKVTGDNFVCIRLMIYHLQKCDR